MNSIKKLFPTILSIICFFIILSSCSKDKISFSSDSELNFEGVSFNINEGRLVFSSEERAKQFFALFKKSDFNEDKFYEKFLTIKNTYDFFPLEPFQDENEVEEREINMYIDLKEKELGYYEPFFKGTLKPELSDESYFIADSFFATMLNQNGEIQIGNQIYKYTPIGLFVVTKSNYDDLTLLFENKSKLENIFSNRVNYSSLSVVEGEISYFVPETNHLSITDIDPSSEKDIDHSNFEVCGGSQSSTLFNLIFGPSADCSEHFLSYRRLKTKAWNQNYLLFSSIGLSVRSQRRKFRIWWASNIDEIQLGYDYASFLYPPVKIELSDGVIRIPRPVTVFEFPNGNLFNRFGQSLATNPFAQQAIEWPFKNEDLLSIDIYLGFTNDIEYDFNLADFNDDLENALEGFVTSGLGDFRDKPVNLFDLNAFRTAFTAANWTSGPHQNDNKITKVFDFTTAVISFGGNPSTGDLGFSIGAFSSDFDEADFLVWGGGRRGNTTLGSRVRFTQN